MANFSRLIPWLLGITWGLALLVWGGDAHAYGFVNKKAAGEYTVYTGCATFGGGWCTTERYEDAQSACDRISVYASSVGYRASGGTLKGTTCEIRTYNDAGYAGSVFGSVSAYVVNLPARCPNGSDETAPGSSDCKCVAGSAATLANECQEYTCPASGPMSLAGNVIENASRSVSLCLSGCKAVGSMAATGADGKSYTWGPFSYDGGQRCEDGDPGPTGVPNVPPSKPGDGNTGDPAPMQCPKQQCPGTVNGTALCVPCSSSTAPPIKEEATGDAGIPNAPPGTTRVEKSTDCNANGVCKTETVYYNGSGSVIGRISAEEGAGGFCAKNPGHNMCAGQEKQESAFGGACGGFTCKGDAIQCAMAKEQHQRNCTLFEQETALSRAGLDAANGQAMPEGHPGRNPEVSAFALSSLISQDSGGLAGGCPTDVVIPAPMGGPAITLPFSQACDALKMVGNIAVAICMVSAAFIVFRG